MASWFTHDDAIERVAASDRGLQYGDGLFETIAVRDGKCRLWRYHMQRLDKGCGRLGISKPGDAELLTGITRALQRSGVPDAYCVVKIVVTAGVGRRGYGRSDVQQPSVLYGVFPATPPPLESYRDGLDTVLCKTRLAIDSPTAGLKTLNRLEQVLARSEFIASGEFEGLTMDAEDNIICGTMSNVFCTNDNTVLTPSLDRCGVEGVMRRHVIEVLRDQGIETQVRAIKCHELADADEVFVSNSQFGVMPVRSCAEMQWPVGAMTRKVMALLVANGIVECRL